MTTSQCDPTPTKSLRWLSYIHGILRSMGDLKNKKLIYMKGGLFLAAGIISAILLVAEQPTVKVVFLLGLSIWCFCRFYYFAFYVIQNYVDSEYKFAGLWSFVKYLVGRK